MSGLANSATHCRIVALAAHSRTMAPAAATLPTYGQHARIIIINTVPPPTGSTAFMDIGEVTSAVAIIQFGEVFNNNLSMLCIIIAKSSNLVLLLLAEGAQRKWIKALDMEERRTLIQFNYLSL